MNYLPVVRVEDWLRRHGGLLVLEKMQIALRGRFIGLLKKRGLSDSLLDVYSPSEIAAHYFPPLDGEPTNNKSRVEKAESEKAALTASEMEAVEAALRKSPLENAFPDALFTGKTDATQPVLADLVSHKLSGYYFLPTVGEVTEFPSSHGYVVILREVRSLYRETARLVLDGLSKEKIDPEATYSGVSFDPFDFAYPIAELRSPWVEHLLQVFCTMFGRIGVEDSDRSLAKSIAESVFPIPETP